MTDTEHATHLLCTTCGGEICGGDFRIFRVGGPEGWQAVSESTSAPEVARIATEVFSKSRLVFTCAGCTGLGFGADGSPASVVARESGITEAEVYDAMVAMCWNFQPAALDPDSCAEAIAHHADHHAPGRR